MITDCTLVSAGERKGGGHGKAQLFRTSMAKPNLDLAQNLDLYAAFGFVEKGFHSGADLLVC
jgi:hypothetical protein